MTAIPIRGLGTREQRLYLLYSLGIQINRDQRRAQRLIRKALKLYGIHMTPELMITQLLGTPYAPRGSTYDALDCFGVIELWYRDVLGIEVVDRAQHPSTHQGLKDGFDQAIDG